MATIHSLISQPASQTIREARAFRMPSLADLVPAKQSVIPIAYGQLLEASGDLMDHAMKDATAEEAAVIYHLAQAMAERMLVVKQLAETRLERLKLKEGA